MRTCERELPGAGRGLFATDGIGAGDVVGSYTYLSAQQLLRDSPKLATALADVVASQSLARFSEKYVLSLALVLARRGLLAVDESAAEEPNNGERRFAAYVASLPREQQSGVWSSSPLLQHTSLWPAIQAKRRHIEAWSRTTPALFDDDAAASLQMWQWAEGIVSSRTLGIAEALSDSAHEEEPHELLPGLSSSPDVVLVPGLDMCNHASGPTARWQPASEAGELSLVATRDIGIDEQITISYGEDKTNDELYFNYGFVMVANPHKRWTVMLPDPKSSSTASVGDESREPIWQRVKRESGLERVVHFTLPIQTPDTSSGASLTEDDGSGELAHWRGVFADVENCASVYLAACPNLLEGGAIYELFADEPAEQSVGEAELLLELRRVVSDFLKQLVATRRAEIDAALALLGLADGAEENTTARTLLSDELSVMTNLLTRLAELQL